MLLDAKNVTYEEVAVDSDAAERRLMASRAGSNTVPQIWIGEQHIGGCDELYQLERAGLLDGLLGEDYE
jgi:glutaredoxin 3